MLSRIIALLHSTVLLITLTACATTQLSGGWQDESLSGKKLQNVLIIGAAKQPDIRKLFEDEFVRQLKAQNVKAVASYTIIKADQMLERDTVVAEITKLGVDGVIVTRLTGLNRKREIDAGSSRRVPFAQFNQMNEFFQRGFEPGESSPLTAYRAISLETNIYYAETENLVWFVESDVQMQDSIRNLTNEFITRVVNRMLSDKVI